MRSEWLIDEDADNVAILVEHVLMGAIHLTKRSAQRRSATTGLRV